MKVVDQSAKVEYMPSYYLLLSAIEGAGRTCYKSPPAADLQGSEDFVRRLIAKGHESVLEHQGITVRVISDRGITHELVRHRLASYSQESTRYCDYSDERFGCGITVVRPSYPMSEDRYSAWWNFCKNSEEQYLRLVWDGCPAQEARWALPWSLKTEIVITANIREWRTILRQRCAPDAHPQMRDLMRPLLRDLYGRAPVFFEDLYGQYCGGC